ncbi:MAG: RagB/SusD family nutrient uptake outer membrane protein [Tannerella sp.]|nr:RagB/SusD family nutrient uptake outer membrane protein [Tannerella sp.]
MKQIKIILSILTLSVLLLPSCAKYLDVVPDNTLTLEEIFATKESAYDALAKVYSYMPYESDTHRTTWSLGDEYVGRLDYNDQTGSLLAIRIMRGLQSETAPILGFWSGWNGAKPLYQGLNQCEIFLNYIDLVQDMTEQEINDWKAQVKFLKAYYAFLLVQYYGPIVLPPEGVIDPDASSDVLFQPRTKVEECFTYIINLMDEAIPDLTERATANNAGQVDQIAARAIKARVLFFRASPFFNGNQEYFGDFYDHDGQPFFPMQYDANKWQEAITALNEAIALAESNGKALYTFQKEPYLYDTEAFEKNRENMQILYNNRMVVCDPWNQELVWGNSNINYYGQGELSSSTNMRLPSGYEGQQNTPEFSWQWMAATYQVMSRYYTKNGLPTDEDLTFDTDRMFDIVTTPGQNEPEYQELWGIMQPGVETIQMYLDREPRFYANMAITGGYWRTQAYRMPTMMYQGQIGGFNSSQHTTDYYCTGIALKKFVHPENMSGAWQRTIKYPYPIVRMADLYLMKAEALNEFSGPSQEVYDLINRVRRRAGIPDVETVWADATIAKTVNKHRTKEGLRDIILQERGIELAFEGSRFWDMHRHKRAVREFSVPISGWKYDGTSSSTFFVLEAKQTRRFTLRDCLWPIDLNEMNTNGNLIQNPGW